MKSRCFAIYTENIRMKNDCVNRSFLWRTHLCDFAWKRPNKLKNKRKTTSVNKMKDAKRFRRLNAILFYEKIGEKNEQTESSS